MEKPIAPSVEDARELVETSKRTNRILQIGLPTYERLRNEGKVRFLAFTAEGPNGPVKAEKWGFGPGRLFVYTRVVADETTVSVDMQ